MCGISGIYNLDGNPVNGLDIEKMNSVMIHRGPDGGGVFVEDNIGLGHRRLKIIDLETGYQPMADKNNEIVVVFNGEIYNFLELKKELQSKGHIFSTKSDTETIIYSYLEYGDCFLEKLRGMFAIALWDKRQGRLVLARDRVGKKPLYYYFDGKRLFFASELKSLMALDDIPRSMDYKALDCYFSFGYVPSPFSIIKNIKKIEPGHMAVCSLNKGLEHRKYWDIELDSTLFNISEEDCIEELVEIFDESVKLRMISDVPLGAFLSGGVDSSAVVASMALLMPDNPVKTSSVGFMEKKFSELSFAGMVSEKYKTDHKESVIKPDALDIIDKMLWHFDEPFADSSAIPTWYVSGITRKRVTVALSGDGGDENFAGYTNRYSMTRLEDSIRKRIPSFIKKSLLPGLANIYPRLDILPRPLRLKAFLTNLSLSLESAYSKDMSFYFNQNMKNFLYSPFMKSAVKNFSSDNILCSFFAKCKMDLDSVSKAQYVDIKTYMTEDILVKVDRMSMAHSLEVRSPVLDHKFMEYAAKIPSNLKLNKKESKYIFKKMNEKRLPAKILYRQKQGFSIPLSLWLKTDLRELVEETLFKKGSDFSYFINIDYVKKIWDIHLKGINDYGSQLWNILIFALWEKKIFSRK
ncbi:MAG: asparagine synthase (glutamine-hydrolyzing) [Deltaproteobacteria bacterium]|nr:MAG: asparagine synthase (glutamine-hydrolyzing) [Deltaproteobacteria bacterium]